MYNNNNNNNACVSVQCLRVGTWCYDWRLTYNLIVAEPSRIEDNRIEYILYLCACTIRWRTVFCRRPGLFRSSKKLGREKRKGLKNSIEPRLGGQDNVSQSFTWRRYTCGGNTWSERCHWATPQCLLRGITGGIGLKKKKKSNKFALKKTHTQYIGQKKTTVGRPIGGLVFFVRPIASDFSHVHRTRRALSGS